MCGHDVSGVQASISTEQMAAQAPLPRGGEAMQQEMVDHLRHATLGEYEIQGELGRGGMATVYLAHEIALDRKVAIKVMSPSLVTGEGMIERFKREARTSASLSHPNIIPVYAVRETDRLLFFVMKFVQGRPLDSIIKEVGPLPIPMVKAILAQAGSAFGYAHRRGIVHRDIKPANIMIDDEGWAVVTDFGIAKVSESQGLTMTGMTVGTPTYMSPEQCMAQDVTGASDQYSLGVVAYEMLTGRPPFSGGSMMAIMYGHFNEPPPPMERFRPDVPDDLRMAVMRMLEKPPERRWPSVDEAIAAIGVQPLAHDDPTRTRLVALARDGALKTQAMMGKLITPMSPIPGGRRQGRTAPPAGAAGAPTARAQPAGRPVPRSVPAPEKGSKKGLLVGGGVALLAIVGALAVLHPWRKPTVAEPPAPSVTQQAPVEQAPAPEAAPPAASGAAESGAAAAPPPTTESPAPPKPAAKPPLAEKKKVVGAAPSEAEPRLHAQPSNPEPAVTHTGGRIVPDPQELERDRTLYLKLLANAQSARQAAVAAGATDADLAGGDLLFRNAQNMAEAQQYMATTDPLNSASSAYVSAATTARDRASAARAAVEPVLPPAAAPAAPAVDEQANVRQVVQDYSRALAAGNLNGALAAFPEMSAEMQAGYRDWFQKGIRLDTSKWAITSISVSGTTATVTMNGPVALLDKKGKASEKSAGPKSITLGQGTGGWHITNLSN